MNAIVLGGTGLVGASCLQLLVESPTYSNVVALVRRPLELKAPKLKESIFPYDKLDQFTPPVPVHHVFCAFGTTISKAGSEEAMRRIDVDIPLEFFRRMKELGANHVSLVSSLGANPKARSFYSRIKGELEVELLKLRFESVDIFRPSVIGGKRKGDSRFGEGIAQQVLRWAPKSVRTIPAATIAKAMVAAAEMASPGHRTILSRSIWQSQELN